MERKRLDLAMVCIIVSVLATILIPVFATGREMSKQMVCLSNLKCLGTAMMMYTLDNNEVFPLHYDLDNDFQRIPNTCWDKKILPYVISEKFFQCPEYAGTKYLSTYAMNARLASFGNLKGGSIKQIKPAYLSDVKYPACVIMLLDSPNTREGSDRFIGQGSSVVAFWHKELNEKGISMIHDGGDNICFVDGHAKWYKTSESDPGDIKEYIITWNGISFDPGYAKETK